ncbi:MAG: DNA-directed RNA polymerase specialized sigma24 family protein [Candidatus Paceibacteria bacterium]|jgi:DNA-directed RNA polymerase specialized sigma24 family protein
MGMSIPHEGSVSIEQALIERARNGDETAADELILQLAPQLMAWLSGQMGTRLQRFLPVTDVAQESLASFLGSLVRLREGAELSDARRLLFQHARWIVLRRGSDAGQFQGESVCGQMEAITRAESMDRSLGAVTLEDELAWLQEMIEELEADLAVIVRARLCGESFSLLAEQHGISESAVRKRFERGLEELQRLAEARKTN